MTMETAKCRDRADEIADMGPKPPEGTRRFEVYMEFCRWAAEHEHAPLIVRTLSRVTGRKMKYMRGGDIPCAFECGALTEDECRDIMRTIDHKEPT